jgi:3-oxoadipate enol-lactonase
MPKIYVNGTTIGYDLTGEGPPLVLVHGLGLDRGMWRPQIERFAATNTVLAFDTRGAGESGPLAGGGVLARQAADLEGLLTRLAIPRVVLCGISYGGVLTQEFAVTYPQRLAGLVVVDSFPDMKLANPLRRLGLRLSTTIASVALLLPPAVMVPAVRRTYERWPLARDVVTGGYQRMRRVETARIRCAINRADYRSRLARVRCPALGIVGDGSTVLTELMRGLTDSLPDAQLHIVGDSFDPTNLCQPEHFNRLLAAFLTKVDWSAK